MAVIFSRGSLRTVKPCKSIYCKACGLYLNQHPLVDPRKDTSKVFWVGLSAVQIVDGQDPVPLSPTTRTGSLIATIEEPFAGRASFYKTNLVKCLPLKNDKIRYPLEHEMEKCFPNFEFELEVLKPRIVFLLGKLVASFVFKKKLSQQVILPEDFCYETYSDGITTFVPVHHPSFILVYRNKLKENYIQNIQQIIKGQKFTVSSRKSSKKDS